MGMLTLWRETAREFDAAFGPGAWRDELLCQLGSCALFAILLCLVAAIGDAP